VIKNLTILIYGTVFVTFACPFAALIILKCHVFRFLLID
jgi:hypothetical protein